MRTLIRLVALSGVLVVAGCEETPTACTDPSCAAAPASTEVPADPNRPQPTPDVNSWGRAARNSSN